VAAVAGEKAGLLWGFQLWANLPAAQKMIAPRYRDVKAADIPRVEAGGGVVVRVLCGEVAGVKGPVADIAIEDMPVEEVIAEVFRPGRHAPPVREAACVTD